MGFRMSIVSWRFWVVSLSFLHSFLFHTWFSIASCALLNWSLISWDSPSNSLFIFYILFSFFDAVLSWCIKVSFSLSKLLITCSMNLIFMTVVPDLESTNMVVGQLLILSLNIVFSRYCCFKACVMVFVWRRFSWLVFRLNGIFDFLPSGLKCLASALPSEELGTWPTIWCTFWLKFAWFWFLQKFITVWLFALSELPWLPC